MDSVVLTHSRLASHPDATTVVACVRRRVYARSAAVDVPDDASNASAQYAVTVQTDGCSGRCPAAPSHSGLRVGAVQGFFFFLPSEPGLFGAAVVELARVLASDAADCLTACLAISFSHCLSTSV